MAEFVVVVGVLALAVIGLGTWAFTMWTRYRREIARQAANPDSGGSDSDVEPPRRY